MTSYLCDFWIGFMEELRHTDFDFGYFFEDMAASRACLSPAVFEEFMAPSYRDHRLHESQDPANGSWSS